MWARVISAPANVLGRMSHLLDIYERPDFRRTPVELPRGHRRVPQAVLRGPRQAAARRDQRQHASGERARGRLVRVERHARRAHGRVDRERRGQEHGRSLLPDAGAGRDRSASGIAVRFRRTPSGSSRCSGRTGSGRCGSSPEQPEVEFQTGHALWALQAAGVPASNPQVAKAIDYLLAPSTAVRRLDGPAAVVREFPHAVSRNADGGAGAQLVLPSRSACEGVGRGSARRGCHPIRWKCFSSSMASGIR